MFIKLHKVSYAGRPPEAVILNSRHIYSIEYNTYGCCVATRMQHNLVVTETMDEVVAKIELASGARPGV